MDDLLFYTRLAQYYDQIYHYIDYRRQAEYYANVIHQLSKTDNKNILDVCCGTEKHAKYLEPCGFNVTGLDQSEGMLKEARKNNPGLEFIRADMKTFDLHGRKFGAILCLFNAILYNKDEREMRAALSNFHRHLEDGGVLVFDIVDKAIGNRPQQKTYNYQDEKTQIDFEPKWSLDEKKGILDLNIRFEINGKEYRDYYPMGAFSLQEMRNLLTETGFEVFQHESQFENPAPEEALFAACKPLA